MCGIFACIRCEHTLNTIKPHFDKIQHRGPDFSILKQINENIIFGFHRLAIVDPNPRSNQPLTWLRR